MKFTTGHHHFSYFPYFSYVLLLGIVLVNDVLMGSEGKMDEFSTEVV